MNNQITFISDDPCIWSESSIEKNVIDKLSSKTKLFKTEKRISVYAHRKLETKLQSDLVIFIGGNIENKQKQNCIIYSFDGKTKIECYLILKESKNKFRFYIVLEQDVDETIIDLDNQSIDNFC